MGNKIQKRSITGFHLGPGGNPTGIGDYMRQLDEADVPFVIKTVDHYGYIYEATQVMDARLSAGKQPIKNILIFRLSDAHGPDDNYKYDTPPYKDPLYVDDPEGGAIMHWDKTIAKLPPEFDKKRVILEVMNEVDKNFSEWLARFCIKIAELAKRDEYMVSFFGWSSGEPEPQHWEGPEMLKLLRLVGENPEYLSISGHEYSFVVNDIFDQKGYKVLRFRYLFAVCDKYNIPRPEYHVTEFGWTLDDVPEPGQAIKDIAAVEEEYLRYGVSSAAIWYLGSGFTGIANKAQKLVYPVAAYAATKVYEVEEVLPGEIPALPPIEGWEQHSEGDNQVGETIIVEREIDNTTRRSYISAIRGFGETGTPLNVQIRWLYYNKDLQASIWEEEWGTLEIEIPDVDIRGMEIKVPVLFSETKTVVLEVECPGDSVDPSPDPEDSGFLVSDVSHHQGYVDFAKMKEAGVPAVQIKATESDWFTSPTFRDFYAAALAVYKDKFRVIPYHYYRFDTDPVTQADYCWSVIGDYDTPLMVDVEDPDNSAVGKSGDLKLFLDIMEYRTGHRPLIYTGSWWWTAARWGGGVPWAKDYYIIEAEYVADPAYPAYADLDHSLSLVKGAKPSVSADFDSGKILTWQFSSKIRGSLFGCSSQYVDMQWTDLSEAEYKSAVQTPSQITSDPVQGGGGGPIDTLEYLRGADGQQTDNELTGQTQTYNYQWLENDEWALVKGTDGKGGAEYYYHDDDFIYRLFDTTENTVLGWWYAHYVNGKQGAPWLPRHVSVGSVYSFAKQVTHYTLPCDVRDGLNKVPVTDSIRVVALHPVLTLGTGAVINDVLELFWEGGGETYYFAKGKGLVGFTAPGHKSEYSNDLFGRSPLEWIFPDCVTAERYYVD